MRKGQCKAQHKKKGLAAHPRILAALRGDLGGDELHRLMCWSFDWPCQSIACAARIFMAFSSRSGTSIHLGFPAIAEAAVPARHPLSRLSCGCACGSLRWSRLFLSAASWYDLTLTSAQIQLSKSGYFAELTKAGKFRWEIYDEKDLQTRIYGEAAVVIGSIILKPSGAQIVPGRGRVEGAGESRTWPTAGRGRVSWACLALFPVPLAGILGRNDGIAVKNLCIRDKVKVFTTVPQNQALEVAPGEWSLFRLARRYSYRRKPCKTCWLWASIEVAEWYLLCGRHPAPYIWGLASCSCFRACSFYTPRRSKCDSQEISFLNYTGRSLSLWPQRLSRETDQDSALSADSEFVSSTGILETNF